MSYHLVEAWLKKMQPSTVTDTTRGIMHLLDDLEDINGFKIFIKFKTKVVKPAFTDGYTYVKLRSLYNYVLQHSSFKDDPEYAIKPLPEVKFNTDVWNYFDYLVRRNNIVLQ